MKSKQIGLTEYNDVILSLYDANPIASVGDSVKKAPEPENKSEKPKGPTVRKVGTKSLLKETYKMRLAAVANLKLRKRMFEYEKQRFKQLTVDFGKLSKDDKDKDLQVKKITPKKDKKGGGLGLGKFLRKLFGNLLRRFKTKFKRKLGYKNRKRWKNLKRNLKVRSKKFWRGITRPFRQGARVLKNLPGRTVRGIADKFTAAGRARSLSRANRSYAKFIKGTANAGDKLRLVKEGLITPSQALSKGGASALEVPKTPNIFRDTFDQLGKPFKGGNTQLTRGATAIADTFKAGKSGLIGGANAAAGFFGNQFQRFTNFATKRGSEALKGTNKFFDDALKFGKSAIGTLTRWGKVLADPQTYVKIKNQFAAGVDKLKGVAKGLYDALVEKVASHPMFKKVVKSRVGKKVFGKLGKKALGKLLGKLIIGVGTALAIWEAIEDFARGDYEGAALALLSAIPLFGIIPAVIDILKDLFPESWESIVSDITGKSQDERNINIKDFYDKTFTPMENAGANDIKIDGAAAEGMFVEAKPQLVLVGEGGEEEFIVPKSKLNYFLGSDAALEVMNAGASAVFSSASEYLKGTGLLGRAKNFIPELAYSNELEPVTVSKFKGKQHTVTDIGKKVKETIMEAFKALYEKIKSFIPNIPDGIKNIAGGLFRLLQPRGADAATIDGQVNALSAGHEKFGGVSGQSGSVAYNGRSSAPLSVAYSPFSASDVSSKNIQIISGFGQRGGRMHKGFDLAAPAGTPIHAYLPGKVTRVAYDSGGYGYYIEWQDSIYNEKHLFGHMVRSSPLKVGDQFSQGALLGNVGSTGISEGPHLHWEIGAQGSEVDPAKWINSHPIKKQTPKAEPVALNKNKPVEPTPEPDPSSVLELLAPAVQAIVPDNAPQIIPVPIQQIMSALSSGNEPQYPTWGLGIKGGS